MNFNQASEYNIALFDSALSQSSLGRVISVGILSSDKVKLNPSGLCGKVYRTNDVVKQAIQSKFSGVPDFVIVINEEIFDRLEESQQHIIVDKLLAQLGFDYEKGNTSLIAPDIQEFSGILKKYNFNELEALKLYVESLYESRNEQEQEQKESKKKKRKKINE
jgi:hypothetical protein